MADYKHYLGDSVYVEFEDGMVKLTTNNGYDDDPRNVIYMDMYVRSAYAVWWEQTLNGLKRKALEEREAKNQKRMDQDSAQEGAPECL